MLGKEAFLPFCSLLMPKLVRQPRARWSLLLPSGSRAFGRRLQLRKFCSHPRLSAPEALKCYSDRLKKPKFGLAVESFHVAVFSIFKAVSPPVITEARSCLNWEKLLNCLLLLLLLVRQLSTLVEHITTPPQ